MASIIKCTNRLKKLVQGLLAKRFLLRVFMLISAIAALPFLFVSELNLVEYLALNSGDCTYHATGSYLESFTFIGPPSSSPPCRKDNNFTYAVFRALMDLNLLPPTAKALCVGERSGAAAKALWKLGFPHPISASGYPFSLLRKRDFVEELAFEDGAFDFIFSRGLNKASAPALHILEMERVLKPGGVGAVMEPVANADPNSMIKAASPVSSFLKCSDIVYVGMIDGFSLAVFKKKSDDLSSIEQLQLPKLCPSVTNNKPFLQFLEPLVDKFSVEDRKNVAYLSKHMNISSSKKQLMYVDVGAGRFDESSIATWFLPFYPKHNLPLQIYALDHDSSTLSSFAQRHDITFVYYPALGETMPAADYDPLDDSAATLPFDEDDDESNMFDFLGWFKDTVEEDDFVVLKMSIGGVGRRDLLELVESGAFCLVDELFLHCPNNFNGGDSGTGPCFQLFKTLRRMGVYVHQW